MGILLNSLKKTLKAKLKAGLTEEPCKEKIKIGLTATNSSTTAILTDLNNCMRSLLRIEGKRLKNLELSSDIRNYYLTYKLAGNAYVDKLYITSHLQSNLNVKNKRDAQQQMQVIDWKKTTTYFDPHCFWISA